MLPTHADIAFFGVLRAVEGFDTHKDVMENTTLEPWCVSRGRPGHVWRLDAYCCMRPCLQVHPHESHGGHPLPLDSMISRRTSSARLLGARSLSERSAHFTSPQGTDLNMMPACVMAPQVGRTSGDTLTCVSTSQSTSPQCACMQAAPLVLGIAGAALHVRRKPQSPAAEQGSVPPSVAGTPPPTPPRSPGTGVAAARAPPIRVRRFRAPLVLCCCSLLLSIAVSTPRHAVALPMRAA